MWFLGAVLGAVLAGSFDFSYSIFGALIGGILGWQLTGRGRAAPDERGQRVEAQLARLEARLQRVEQLLAASAAPGEVAAGVPPPAAALAATAAQPEPEALAEERAEALTEATVPPAPVAQRFAETPPEPTAPAKARQPSAEPGDRTSPLWERLLRGNTMAKAGIVVLFFGMAFLLKYAYQHVQVPIELRLAGVALGALVLLVIGWRLRRVREGYGLALQGGGVGLLYLTIFGALRLFELLSVGPAFALLLAVAAVSAVLAVVQDSRALAVLGATGGFLAPILASTGSGSHVALFAYYALLNGGILAIAWFKSWRVLNRVGFVFTFGIATVWGVLRYQPEFYASTEPFLLLFFLMYVTIPVLFARRDCAALARPLDGTLVFGVPLLGFGLQVALVRDFAYGSAYSALALGAFYLLLARVLWPRREHQAERLLGEAFLALGVVFSTLAIPLACDGRWTAAAWALEGAAILWVGVRQNRLPARLFGSALQFPAAYFYLADLAADGRGEWWTMPVLNGIYLGALLLAVAALFCAWFLQRHRERVQPAEQGLATLLFVWGLACWAGGGMHEIDRFVPALFQGSALLCFAAASCLVFSALHRRLAWPAARHPALALLPLMALLALWSVAHEAHPFAHLGYLAWPLAFAAQLYLLKRHESSATRVLECLHAGGLILFAALGAWESAWAIDTWVAGRATWPLLGWALLPAALLALLARRGERFAWPVAAHRQAYLVSGAIPIAIFLVAWFLVVNVISDGDPWPLPWLPLLNPLDLAQAGVVLALADWFLAARRQGLPPLAAVSPTRAWSSAGLAGFLWANAALLRTLHHWGGVPWQLHELLASDLVQAALSLFWTLLALAAMVHATRRGWRSVWLVGAGLMTVVVGKLFLVDLSNVGSIARIVSFLGVGVLMLVIGYLAPLPPKAGNNDRQLADGE